MALSPVEKYVFVQKVHDAIGPTYRSSGRWPSYVSSIRVNVECAYVQWVAMEEYHWLIACDVFSAPDGGFVHVWYLGAVPRALEYEPVKGMPQMFDTPAILTTAVVPGRKLCPKGNAIREVFDDFRAIVEGITGDYSVYELEGASGKPSTLIASRFPISRRKHFTLGWSGSPDAPTACKRGIAHPHHFDHEGRCRCYSNALWHVPLFMSWMKESVVG
jgi:hypothetical protein